MSLEGEVEEAGWEGCTHLALGLTLCRTPRQDWELVMPRRHFFGPELYSGHQAPPAYIVPGGVALVLGPRSQVGVLWAEEH